MGLILAATEAVNGLLADQWREYFYCDAMSDGVLMVKGKRRNNANNNGREGIISNGSIIAVNEGQCMILVDQGRITEVSATAGMFVYDSSAEPSIFSGNLGDNLVNSVKTMWTRFSGAGDTMRDQRIYFVNTLEIKNNFYGTSSPIPFRIVDANIGLDMDTLLKCSGEFSYRITDPVAFYRNVAGNVADEYRSSDIEKKLKAELVTALMPVLAQIGAKGVRPNQVPGHLGEVVDLLNEELSEKWTATRGFSVVSLTMNPPSIPEEDRQMLNELQKNKVLTNPGMAAATLVSSQAEAMKLAAANESTGPMMAFAGMNMANMVGGMNSNTLYQMAGQQQAMQQPVPNAAPVQPTAPVAPILGWTCSCGHADNRGKFCAECGAKKPEEAGWTCSCGAVNQGKFCCECGAKKPEGAPIYKCDKCGWEPEDPANPPKFCPQCGDRFDENDIVK